MFLVGHVRALCSRSVDIPLWHHDLGGASLHFEANSEMTKRPLNLEYEFCRALAIESGNESHQNIMRFKAELKSLRTWKDHEGIVRHGFNGKEIIGYSLDEIIETWRWLRTREEFPIVDARLTTTLKGSPCNLLRFDEWIMDNLPPVYDSSSHDAFVLERAKILKSLGFEYRCENQPGRLSSEQLMKCGLKENENGVD